MTEWSGADANLLAGLVLRRVEDVRDRLVLECVSRAWRSAGATASWQARFSLSSFLLLLLPLLLLLLIRPSWSFSPSTVSSPPVYAPLEMSSTLMSTRAARRPGADMRAPRAASSRRGPSNSSSVKGYPWPEARVIESTHSTDVVFFATPTNRVHAYV